MDTIPPPLATPSLSLTTGRCSRRFRFVRRSEQRLLLKNRAETIRLTIDDPSFTPSVMQHHPLFHSSRLVSAPNPSLFFSRHVSFPPVPSLYPEDVSASLPATFANEFKRNFEEGRKRRHFRPRCSTISDTEDRRDGSRNRLWLGKHNPLRPPAPLLPLIFPAFGFRSVPPTGRSGEETIGLS